MQVTLKAEALKNKLGYINHAVSNKQQLPILLNILLEAVENKLILSSTDLEIGIQVELSAEVSEAGKTTVPARTFSELVNSLSADTLTIETEGNNCVVRTHKTKSVFSTMSANEFPRLFEERGVLLASINAVELKKELNAVVFSASIDIARPSLSGVYVEQQDQGFLLVATDGYRLSLKHFTVGKDDKVNLLEGKPSMIVPARAFKEALVIKEETDKIDLYVSSAHNQIIFKQGGAILISRLIEAEFPNYEKIIPVDFSVTASFDREEMLKAVRICSIFARDIANVIKFSLHTDKIVVSAGENIVEVDCKIKGEENEIAFNSRYLLEALNNLPSENINFEMTGPLNPGVFKTTDDASYLHLIMPIKVQE